MSAQAFRAMAELAASSHGVVTRSQAAELGLSNRAVDTAKRRGWLSEPAPGALVVNGHPRTWRQDLAVVTSASAARPVVSHRSAARLHRLDGCELDLLEVSVQRSRRYTRPRSFDVVEHHVASIPPCDLVRIEGLVTTGLARTLCDLGSVVPKADVWKALIGARRLHHVNALWLNRTALRLHRPGQRGSGVLLRALDRWATEGQLPATWFEDLVCEMLRDPDIPPLVRQFEIRDSNGRFVARTDLAVPSARLGIEAHSREFHFGPEREAADEDRDLRVAAVGWELLYLGWYSQRRPRDVADLVAQVCRRRMTEV